jgi:hypothetical protein
VQHVSEDIPDSDFETRRQDALFESLFGITKGELRAKGIDPGVFATQHAKAVLDDPAKRRLLGFPVSSDHKRRATKLDLGGCVCIVLALFCLLLSRYAVVRIPALVLAGLLTIAFSTLLVLDFLVQ